jgi:hypothetical protein
VRTDREAVAHLATALGAPAGKAWDGESVPLTFPIVWLGLPEVRERSGLSTLTEGLATVLHVEQTFDYAGRLAVDRDYDLHVAATRADGPDAPILLTGRVEEPGGEPVASMTATLYCVGLADHDGPTEDR